MNPKALENKPESYGWMKEYLDAFNTLNATRQYGMGPNPIQLTEIVAYLQLYETEDKAAFIEYVLKMDAAFLEVKAKQAERQSQQEQSKAKGKDSGQRHGTRGRGR